MRDDNGIKLDYNQSISNDLFLIFFIIRSAKMPFDVILMKYREKMYQFLFVFVCLINIYILALREDSSKDNKIPFKQCVGDLTVSNN